MDDDTARSARALTHRSDGLAVGTTLLADRPDPTSGWPARIRIGVQELLVTADALEAPEGAAGASGKRQLIEEAREHLRAADRIASRPLLSGRLSGGAYERATLELSMAQLMLLDLLPPEALQVYIPDVLRRVRDYLPPGDRRRAEMERLVRKGRSSTLTTKDRAAMVAAVAAATNAQDRAYARIRTFRNVVVLGVIFLTLLAAAVAVVAALRPRALELCFESDSTAICPAGRSSPSSSDYVAVEATGMVSASVAAVGMFRVTGAAFAPFGIPIALLLLKLPAGALTAVLGLMLMEGQFFPGLQVETQDQILAWALVFGYAQQLFTRYVDKQAEIVLREADEVQDGHTGPEVQDQVIEALRDTVTTAEFEQQLAQAVRKGIRGEPLDNYTGHVVAAFSDAAHRPVDQARDAAFFLTPGASYELVLRLQPEQPRAAVSEPIVIEGGRDVDEVAFRLAIVCPKVSFQPRTADLRVGPSRRAMSKPFRFVAPQQPGKYDAWAHVHQKNRLVSVLPLALLVE